MGRDANYTAGSTGGSYAHTHSTSNHTLTVDEIPKHRHDMIHGGRMVYWDSGLTPMGQSYGSSNNNYQTTWDCYTTDTGGGGGHNHGNTGSTSTLPAYLAVYMWKRTA